MPQPHVVIIPHNNTFIFKNISPPIEFYNFGCHLIDNSLKNFDEIKKGARSMYEYKGLLLPKCTIPVSHIKTHINFTENYIKKLANDINAIFQHACFRDDHLPPIFCTKEGEIDIPNNLKRLNKAITLLKHSCCYNNNNTTTTTTVVPPLFSSSTACWLIMKHNYYRNIITNAHYYLTYKKKIEKFIRNCALIEYYFLPHVFIPPRYPDDRIKVILKFDNEEVVPTEPLELNHPIFFCKVSNLKREDDDEKNVYDVTNFWSTLEDLIVPPWKKTVFHHIAKIAADEKKGKDKIELIFRFDKDLKLIDNVPEIRRQLTEFKSPPSLPLDKAFVNANWYQHDYLLNICERCQFFCAGFRKPSLRKNVYPIREKFSNICLPCEYYPFFYNNLDDKLKTKVVLLQFDLPICISLEKCSNYYLHLLERMNEIISSFSTELEKKTITITTITTTLRINELLENINEIWIRVCDFFLNFEKEFYESIKTCTCSQQYWYYFWLHAKHYRYYKLLSTYSCNTKKEIFIQWTQPFVVLEHLFLRDFDWAIMAPPHYPVKINTVVIDGGEREKLLTLPFDTIIVDGGKKEKIFTPPFNTNIGITDLKIRIYQARIKFTVNLSKEKTYVMFIRNKKKDEVLGKESNDIIVLSVNKDIIQIRKKRLIEESDFDIIQIRKKRLIEESDFVKAMIGHYPEAQISYKDPYGDENEEIRESLVSKLFKEYFGDEGIMIIEQQYISELYRVTDYYQMLKLRSACLWFLNKN